MKPDAPLSFKFVNMVLACTGGGILVPIFINGLPVPLAVDAVAIAITTSIFIHTYFPQIRTFLQSNAIFMVRSHNFRSNLTTDVFAIYFIGFLCFP